MAPGHILRRATTSSSEDCPPDSHINHATSIEYWNGLAANPRTMLGIMGDYPWYTRIDLRGSKTFLWKARRLIPGCTKRDKLKRAVDCGAGVGRVTEGFLRDVCERVDAVEPVGKFADVIREKKVKDDQGRSLDRGGDGGRGEIGEIYGMGIESWVPKRKYELIWTQFCANYVTDVQFVEFLQRCCGALTETGIVVLKENISTDLDGKDMYDEEDSSVTRTDGKFRALFKEAKLDVIASELQLGFPKHFNLLPVRFYALRPQS
ncbi:alpha-N-methyltransferase NTM1 [Aspergillus aurantiobrunneus]